MRLFIAVEISDEVKRKIAKIQEELSSDKIKIVGPALIHITLRFLGEVDESRIDEVKEALSFISLQPIHLKCKGVGVFPNEKFIRVIWTGIEGVHEDDLARIEAVAADVERSMVALGFEKTDYPFSPHVTIGRPRTKVDITEFLKKYKNKEFGDFTVDKIKLKKSTLTPKGPIYEDL